MGSPRERTASETGSVTGSGSAKGWAVEWSEVEVYPSQEASWGSESTERRCSGRRTGTGWATATD